MPFESLNALDGGPGQQRHDALGKPNIPALVVDGRAIPLLHVSQIASVLDLPNRVGGNSVGLAWDIISIQESFVGLLPRLTWDVVMTPTPARGRTLRNITVNAFHPFELVTRAWTTCEFPWYTGDADVEREQPLTDVEKLHAFAKRHHDLWVSFVLDVGDGLDERDPVVTSHRGDVPFSVLLESQRWHLAYHHRHLVDAMDRSGIDASGALDVTMLVDLPEDLY